MSAPPRPLNLLLATKGHPFQREPFFQLFDSLAPEGISWTHVEQPAAQRFYQPSNAEGYDVIVDYSMWGVGFGRKAGDPAPEPPAEFRNGLIELMEAGTHGFVFLHHHICSWPAWDEYAEIVGGRFLYYPDQVRGVPTPDSGYLLGVESNYVVVAPDHPVTQGLPPTFSLQDELYLAPCFEDSVIPLIRSDFVFENRNFFSAYNVVGKGKMYNRDDWAHPPGSSAVCWVKHYGNSPIVYIQAGDAPSSYRNPVYRQLLLNAVRWAASPQAKAWARARARGGGEVQPSIAVVPSHPLWPRKRREPERNDAGAERICLFCDQDGVERYGGVMDQHTVSNGVRALRGPLCGNCHVLLLDHAIDTGGWRIGPS